MIGKPQGLTSGQSAAKSSFDLASMGPRLIWWGTFALLGFTVFYPCLVLVINSFKADGNITFANYVTLFRDPAILTSMTNSLKVVVPSTIIATILGVLLAWIVARTNIRGKKNMANPAGHALFDPAICRCHILDLSAWTCRADQWLVYGYFSTNGASGRYL